MNRFFPLIFISIPLLFSNANAQISEGGKPLTMRLFGINNLDSALQANLNSSSINDLSKTQLRAIKVSQVELTAPDLAPVIKQDRAKNKKTDLYREGVAVAADISIKSSGQWTILDDGEKIWRLKIHLPGAKAIGLYYDHFYLPQGAKYFLFNENGHQVLGAYTSNNNPDDDQWANEKVQGDLINLELDLPADADTSSVYMHINYAADFYRATEYLNHYKSIDKIESTLFPYGGSSPCEINAICSIGIPFSEQRKATVKIEYQSNGYIYGVSATCMNNTSQNCIPYILTASHADPTNSTSSKTFSTWMFYFNYETPTCIYTGVDSNVFSSQTMRGANFVSRSSYDSSVFPIVGDFLLLQLKESIPVNYNVYFSGWDNTGNTPIGTSISFHHPSGDVKKVAATNKVSPYGNFNGGEPDSHWELDWYVENTEEGGTEEGSSGSGLFESNGRLIGDLTGGGNLQPTCTDINSSGVEITVKAYYSKFSLNWYYVYETDSSNATSLHHWLDPVGNGSAQTLDAIPNTAACIASAIPTIKQSEISVNLYPNPTTGNLFADINLDKASDLKIEIYNMIGAKVYEQEVPDVLSGKYSLDISNQPSGTYLVRISTASSSITEKIISVNK